MLGTTISHYRIVRELGAGGMGVVYEAEDTRLRRNVALKFLSAALAQDAPMLERFEREARAASALSHPGICTVHAIEQDGGQSFIVMELVDGESLATRLAGGPMQIGPLLDLGIQMADALEAAHAKGIVHRDLKPMNMMVTARGQVKILDFGLAKFEHNEASAQTTSPTAPPRGGPDRRRDGVRHGPLHVARAGARADDRRAHRPLLARRDPLPDGHRRSGLRGGHAGGGLRRDPEPRSAAARGGEPGDARGARADPREGAREGPRPFATRPRRS